MRIFELKSDWDEHQVADLEENLARLVSPFARVDDFSILFTPPGRNGKAMEVEISAPGFLSKPKYAIRGRVHEDGQVACRYEFSPLGRGTPKSTPLSLSWEQIVRTSPQAKRLDQRSPGCGPFEFEIRAWDIGSDDTQEIADHFNEKKGSIRKAIHAHKGISVYRDRILVLPKSDDARDWLGIDLRRVSKTGTRLSTNQIVGYVSISGDANTAIQDTSDREGLVNAPAVVAFQQILKAIVALLENERHRDRQEPIDEEQLADLFEDLSADDLLRDIDVIAGEGGSAADALPMVTAFSQRLDSVRSTIKKRFTYYSRLATVGTIAQMLVHEIRNRTTIFGSFIRQVERKLGETSEERLQRRLEQARNAVDALEQLADTFAPLASRGFRRRRRHAVIEASIQRCLRFVVRDIRDLDVEVVVPESTETPVAVDPGELDAIILNLITNAIYWLTQSKRSRCLEFRISRMKGGKRVRLTVHDSGPGIPEDDAEKVFLPGVTRKPGGIGMGLTVASELVSEYGGEMFLIRPGKLGGASFALDLPRKS